jgi:two-component system NarL family sensor kinase
MKDRATGDAIERVATRRASANLGVRMLSLQEEVQQRIASNLHDSAGQHLIAASLGVMRLRRALDDISSAERLCDDIDASIDQALGEIRAFAYLLHPRNLLSDGLKITIEQFVAGFSERTSLKTDIEIAPEVDGLSHDSQRSVLRVIQEALTNVFRHAKATRVKIAMEARDLHFSLRICDNGRGMPIGQVRSDSKGISFGVGIPSMRARLQQMGGALEIRSSSATERSGTTLSALIPRYPPSKRARLPKRRQRQLGHRKSASQQHQPSAGHSKHRGKV